MKRRRISYNRSDKKVVSITPVNSPTDKKEVDYFPETISGTFNIPKKLKITLTNKNEGKTVYFYKDKSLDFIIGKTDDGIVHTSAFFTILIDITSSMQPFIDSALSEIKNIVNTAHKSHEKEWEKIYDKVEHKTYFSIIAYRDFSDTNKIKILNYTDDISKIEYIMNFLNAKGGNDIPEDILGAFDIALTEHIKTAAISIFDKKYITSKFILICDDPCHGQKYNAGFYDTHPEPEEKVDKEWKRIFNIMTNLNINLQVMYINENSKYMIDKFKILYDTDTHKIDIQNMMLQAKEILDISINTPVTICDRFRDTAHEHITQSLTY